MKWIINKFNAVLIEFNELFEKYKISDAYKYASEIMIENMMNKDSEEGINAFIEKRKPKWK